MALLACSRLTRRVWSPPPPARQALIDVMLPLGVFFTAIAFIPVCRAFTLPTLSPRERHHARTKVRRSMTLDAINKMSKLDKSGETLIAEAVREGFFFSPRHFTKGVIGGDTVKARRRLVQIYTTVEDDQLALAFAAAFLKDPTEAVMRHGAHTAPRSLHAMRVPSSHRRLVQRPHPPRHACPLLTDG